MQTRAKKYYLDQMRGLGAWCQRKSGRLLEFDVREGMGAFVQVMGERCAKGCQ